MKNIKAKLISNFIKFLIVAFIFYEYHFQSFTQGNPLGSDSCKGLLFVAIAGFLILLPIDGSVFIKNLYNAKGHINDSGNTDKNTQQ